MTSAPIVLTVEAERELWRLLVYQYVDRNKFPALNRLLDQIAARQTQEVAS